MYTTSKKAVGYISVFVVLLLLSGCRIYTSSQSNAPKGVDKIDIFYWSPEIETFAAVSPQEFVAMTKDSLSINTITLTNKDTLALFTRELEKIRYDSVVCNYLDTRFMFVVYGQDKRDTLFMSAPAPDILYNGKYGVMPDCTFVYSFIKERDSIFPHAKVRLVDGEYYVK